MSRNGTWVRAEEQYGPFEDTTTIRDAALASYQRVLLADDSDINRASIMDAYHSARFIFGSQVTGIRLVPVRSCGAWHVCLIGADGSDIIFSSKSGDQTLFGHARAIANGETMHASTFMRYRYTLGIFFHESPDGDYDPADCPGAMRNTDGSVTLTATTKGYPR